MKKLIISLAILLFAGVAWGGHHPAGVPYSEAPEIIDNSLPPGATVKCRWEVIYMLGLDPLPTSFGFMNDWEPFAVSTGKYGYDYKIWFKRRVCE